jgi:hypothetical protein
MPPSAKMFAIVSGFGGAFCATAVRAEIKRKRENDRKRKECSSTAGAKVYTMESATAERWDEQR